MELEADGQSKLVISRDTAILPRKLDWLLTERLEEFKAIMSDNGTYVQVPAVGSQASLITVFGDHRVNIERTIRSIMALASIPSSSTRQELIAGLPVLCCLVLAFTNFFRCSHALSYAQSASNAAYPQAYCAFHGVRSGL
jgi:hypothetical protein